MSTYEERYRRFLLVSETTADKALAAHKLLTLAGGIDGSALSAKERSALRFVCFSLLINAGTVMWMRREVLAYPQRVRHPSGWERPSDLEETTSAQGLGHFRGAEACSRDSITDGRGDEVRLDDCRKQLSTRYLPACDVVSDAGFLLRKQVTPID
ncbi:hypothetical protein [Dietzia sp. DQ12-76]|uniref:hypothetical protein n=1 Tax=Dietzia sp. DQ12-76 TaxID=1630639 RepID=UPI0015FE1905|nr:hypothetical protein [Dietzia sp. DQ12-76]MBB1022904.1 hypothetical protein [Dietzia sp. DQ12-76]